MSLKWRDEPLLNQAVQVPLLGFDARRLPDGRVLMFEWVHDEGPGVVQVHDDRGRDFIEKGNPTLGMLYESSDRLVEVAGHAFLTRIAETLRGGGP